LTLQILIVLLLAFLGAVVPTILYVNLVWWLDRYEREPVWLLALAFFWGAIPAVLLVFVPEVVFDSVLDSVLGAGGLKNALSFGISPPLFEESAKGIFLLGLMLVFWNEFDDPLDGIVYGSMVGFGFAMTENIVYFIGASQSGLGSEIVNIVLRGVLFGLNHAFFTSWTGLALGWARTHSGVFHRVLVPVLGWLTAMFFHSVHNLGAAFAEATACLSFLAAVLSDWGGILVMTLIAFWLIGRERLWLVAELQPEVASGLLSQQDFDVLISSLRRARARFAALTSRGWLAYRRAGRFYQAATDLAFKKHELRSFGEERGNSTEIALLRSELQKLKAEV
jgi:RsiW-degrading membrane proteinase PrsW (M82 family)